MKFCLHCDHTFASVDWDCPVCGFAPPEIDNHPAFAPELAATGPGFHESIFAELARLEAGSFWFRSRNRLLCWAVRQYFPSARSLLEIGCGTGYVLQGFRSAFPQLALSGSDLFSAGLAFASARLPGVDLFQMDACKIPFVEEFDVIGAFDVLEHIKADDRVLSQMYRAVRPGGGILLTVPQHQFLWSQADVYARHERRYNARELLGKVRRAGFRVVRTTSFVSLLLPLMMAQRLAMRRADPNYSVMKELAIRGPANSMFEQVLTLERAGIRAGVSFPVGGSLFVAAHKVPAGSTN